LKEVSPDWEKTGLELKLLQYVLTNIEDSHKGNEAYFRMMLSTWLKSTSEPEDKTVGRLKEALNRTSNNFIASNLLDSLNHGEPIYISGVVTWFAILTNSGGLFKPHTHSMSIYHDSNYSCFNSIQLLALEPH